jgi:alkane 1-monooxygenase
MKDLKYVFAYITPLGAVMGLWLQGFWVFFTPFFAFILVPLLETILPIAKQNLSKEELISKDKNKFFNVLLYLNIPIVYGLVGYFLWSLAFREYTLTELVGLTISLGIVVGANGINVAHELGHRKLRFERTFGKILLLPALYMHFFIEHNFGHHLHAATPQDPATARYNQSVYSFWFSSIKGQYIKAWSIQKSLLERAKLPFLSSKNDMFWYTLIQFGYLVGVYLFLGELAAGLAFCIALSGVLLLETINYIEHYGLKRNKTASGRYERISEIHSWNSNHVLGRILLYELTRHSDHHYRAHKKFQLLEYHDSSPQMPFGYTTSMVLALAPPLWFLVMNTLIPVAMRP